MNRRKVSSGPDTWEIEEDAEGVRVSRELAPGWREEHRVVSQGRSPVIVETRVLAERQDEAPPGGLRSDLLRRVSLRGAKDAAEGRLLGRARGSALDLRGLEALTPQARRRGERRRWTLALTAWAYVQVVRAGSRRANEDTAAAMGISASEVRDRLHAARRHDPPLLTGGGRQGVVGRPALTEAGERVLSDRFDRIVASWGKLPEERAPPPYAPTGSEQPSGSPEVLLRVPGLVAASNAVYEGLLIDAERRIPGLWEMSLEEVACRGAENPPTTYTFPPGKDVVGTPEGGLAVVDVEPEA